MGSVRPELLGHATGPTWVEARYHFHHGAGKAHQGMHWLSMGGTSDEKRFDVMTIRTEYPYQRLTIAGANSPAAPSLSLWTAYVPVGAAGRANRAFGILLVRKPRVSFALTVAWPVLRHFAKSVFAEDRWPWGPSSGPDAQGDWNQEVSPVILTSATCCAPMGSSGRPAAARAWRDARAGARPAPVPIGSVPGRRSH
jgi:hypothetical protein